jgi:hypothetical protein
MAGMESKKENFAAKSFLIPNNNPRAIVEPLRERPGIIATPCIIPIRKA